MREVDKALGRHPGRDSEKGAKKARKNGIFLVAPTGIEPVAEDAD
jgi:hypothetical protein